MKKTGNSINFELVLGMIRWKRWASPVLLLLFCLIVGHELKAQSPSFALTASKTQLVVGERFQVQFTLNTSGSNFTPPDFKGFRILSGPNPSTRMQQINSNVSMTITYGYILMATTEGKFTIDPAAIRVGSTVLKSNALELTVGQQAQSSASPNAGNTTSANAKDNAVKGEDKNIFLRAIASKTTPYVGEQITVTYRLYFRENVVNYNLEKNPALNGFWSQDIPLNQQQNDRTEIINGERYYFVDLKQLILFPQRSGKLVVDPFEGTFVLRKQTQRRSRSLFDQFFGSYQDVSQEVKSNSININVKALPPDVPTAFKGAVGKFDLNVSLSKQQVKANEGIDLKIKITGSGNFKLQDKPELKLPPDFEVYDPEINDQLTVTSKGVSGSRTYQYLVIPRHKGNYTIPPIQFSYFDAASGKYKTLQSDVFDITVEKGENDGQQQVYGNISKEDVKILGSDIKFIQLDGTSLINTRQSFYGSLPFYVLLFLPFLLSIGLFFIRTQIRKKQGDVVGLRRSRATKIAGKRLKMAKVHLETNAEASFYEELSKALYGYTADKLNMQYAELSKDNIKALLSQQAVKENTVNQLITILETCEMARFAPVGVGSLQHAYDQSVEVIKIIENELNI